MKILSIRPLQGPGAVARFDVEINEHLRLFGLLLKHTANGLRSYSPHSCGKHVASFHPILAQQITAAAIAALEAAADVRT